MIMSKFGLILKSIGNGVLSALPLGNVVKEVKENLQTEVGGKGKVDWPRLISYIIVAGVVFAFIFGKISMQDVKELIKIIL